MRFRPRRSEPAEALNRGAQGQVIRLSCPFSFRSSPERSRPEREIRWMMVRATATLVERRHLGDQIRIDQGIGPEDLHELNVATHERSERLVVCTSAVNQETVTCIRRSYTLTNGRRPSHTI